MDGSQRFGPNEAQTAMKFMAQAFAAFWNFRAGWVGPSSVLYAGYG
jgi:hypothetical protein